MHNVYRLARPVVHNITKSWNKNQYGENEHQQKRSTGETKHRRLPTAKTPTARRIVAYPVPNIDINMNCREVYVSVLQALRDVPSRWGGMHTAGSRCIHGYSIFLS